MTGFPVAPGSRSFFVPLAGKTHFAARSFHSKMSRYQIGLAQSSVLLTRLCGMTLCGRSAQISGVGE